MLVFSRKVREAVRIGGEVTVTILHVRGDQVRLRVTAPHDLGVYKEEIINELSHAAITALISPPANS
ncbi:MAG TPA: carbon storage regulator [Steroidobacteraceae bacterium]